MNTGVEENSGKEVSPKTSQRIKFVKGDNSNFLADENHLSDQL